jgi:hypothetical protein
MTINALRWSLGPETARSFRSSMRSERDELCGDFADDVFACLAEFEEVVGVAQTAHQLLIGLDDSGEPLALAHHALAERGVVPEVGVGDLLFELA